LALFYLSSKKDIVVTGMTTELNHIEQTLKILKIDHIIIAASNTRYIESTFKLINKHSENQPIIILNFQNRLPKLELKTFNDHTHIVSFDQKPESLIYILNSNCETNKKAGLVKSQRQEAYLSQREKEILLLISKGKNSKEIADELFISSNTVENHRNNILKKTRSKNMLSLINHLFRTGFFTSVQSNHDE
jgi:DNA-binding CsgD family transcriptional regulator